MNIKVLGSNSKGNSYLIQGVKSKILIECGLKYDELVEGCDYLLHEIDACIISHEH